RRYVFDVTPPRENRVMVRTDSYAAQVQFRRRRLASLAACAAALVLLAAFVDAALTRLDGTSGGRAAPLTVASEVVVVQPGDTLWGLARDIADPGDDVRAVVHRLVDLNGRAPLQP